LAWFNDECRRSRVVIEADIVYILYAVYWSTVKMGDLYGQDEALRADHCKNNINAQDN